MAVIDRERGYIFFHIPKTAGMSIAAALGEHGGRQVADEPDLARAIRAQLIDEGLEGKPGQLAHVRPARLRALIGAEVYDAMESAAVIRCPWDRIRSLYRYQRRRPAERLRPEMRELIGLSLDDFAVALCASDYPTMTRFLAGADGSPLVDTLLRFERLEDDFASWSERIIGRPIELPRVNQSRDEGGDEGFGEAAISAVRLHFAEDFVRFGYSDSPPD